MPEQISDSVFEIEMEQGSKIPHSDVISLLPFGILNPSVRSAEGTLAPWCNGNTPDFDSGIPGSSPGGATTHLFGECDLVADPAIIPWVRGLCVHDSFRAQTES